MKQKNKDKSPSVSEQEDTTDEIDIFESSQEESKQYECFEAIIIKPELVKSLLVRGPIEENLIICKSLPAVLNGDNLIIKCHKGSGKTTAIAAQILQKINLKSQNVQAIVFTELPVTCE